MPAGIYSEFIDHETGKTIWLPQLYPYCIGTGELSSEELEAWAKTGIIPKELYESYIQETQELEERLRLKRFSEPGVSNKANELMDFILKNKARLYGENVFVKIFSRLESSDPDIVWLSFIKEAFANISLDNPAEIHFYAASKTLTEKYNIDNPRARDILARELVDHCKVISNFKSFHHEIFKYHRIEPKDLDNHLKHEKKQMLILDVEFIELLESIGTNGKKIALATKKDSIAFFKSYEEKGYLHSDRHLVWSLWLPGNEPVNAALMLLSQALWKDKCSKLWHRQSTGTPALGQPIFDGIIPLLSSKQSKKFIQFFPGLTILSHRHATDPPGDFFRKLLRK